MKMICRLNTSAGLRAFATEMFHNVPAAKRTASKPIGRRRVPSFLASSSKTVFLPGACPKACCSVNTSVYVSQHHFAILSTHKYG